MTARASDSGFHDRSYVYYNLMSIDFTGLPVARPTASKHDG